MGRLTHLSQPSGPAGEQTEASENEGGVQSPPNSRSAQAGQLEDELRRLVVSEVGGPALFIRRQPEGIAFGAVDDQRDSLDGHRAESKAAASR
jgi:hypothetical protein